MPTEYRVNAVTRYIVTEYVEDENTGSVSEIGEFANAEKAGRVASSLSGGIPVQVRRSEKDRLIAWAYRHLREVGIREAAEHGAMSVSYGSHALEFFAAAERALPDVADLARTVSYHADMAVDPAHDTLAPRVETVAA